MLKVESMLFGFGKDFGWKEEDILEVNPKRSNTKKKRSKAYLTRLQTQGLDDCVCIRIYIYIIRYPHVKNMGGSAAPGAAVSASKEQVGTSF